MPAPPPELIEVRGGVLTRIRESDAESIAAAVRASLDHLRPWMPWASAAAAEVTGQRQRARMADQQWADRSDFIYLLRPRPEGPVIGTFGLHRRVGPSAIELGYWIHVDHAGQGYATASSAALTDAALNLPDIERIEIHTDEANVASAAVPRKLGYRLDRVDLRPPQAPAESGRLQIWVCDSVSAA